MIRTYKCKNGVIEKSKFYCPRKLPVRGGRKKGNTSVAKHDANARQAVRVLARKLNCNYTSADLLVTCTYDDEHLPMLTSHAEQDKLTRNALRRLKRALKKAGAPAPKIITVPSEIDGVTGRPVRHHVHIVLTGTGIRFQGGKWWIGEKTMDQIWAMGSTYTKQLHNQKDFTPLATYLLRQARTGENVKKYSCSRNMEEPVITERVAMTGRPLSRPSRAYMLEVGPWNEETGCHYMRYVADLEKSGNSSPPGSVW